jgi:hypothetical protein
MGVAMKRDFDPEELFTAKLTAMAKLTRTEFELFGNYYLALSPYGLDRVNAALDQLIETMDSRSPFPSIKQIKQVLDPKADPKTESVEAASRILQAIAKIGPYDVERFRAFVGELGWRVVQRCGGLEEVCSIKSDDVTIHRAQWERIALAQINRAACGLEDQAPRIRLAESPKPEGGELKSIGQLLAYMPKEEK